MEIKYKLKILNPQKIKQAILEIKLLQTKYTKTETIIVYRALDTALNQLGWNLAKLLSKDNK